MERRGERGPGDAQGFGNSLVRLGVGAYWLFFASQKWPAPYGFPPHGIQWMHGYLQQSAQSNPLPLLRQVLTQVVVPNWQFFATGQAVAETLVGVLLIVGLFTRPAALLATLLAIELSLTVAFLNADVGARWLYYLAIPASLAVFVGGPGWLGLGRVLPAPGWVRS